jgi:hypothetical protein
VGASGAEEAVIKKQGSGAGADEFMAVSIGAGEVVT